MKTRIVLLTLGLMLSACGPKVTPTPASDAAIANPASVFCEANAGRLELRTAADGSVSGMCIFPDGTQCEEWAFFRGECKPGVTPTQTSSEATSGVPEVQPVMLQVLLPEDGSMADLQQCQVIGTTSPSAILSVNDQILIVNTDGTFQTTVALEPGVNLIEVVASNAVGSEASVDLTVTYEPRQSRPEAQATAQANAHGKPTMYRGTLSAVNASSMTITLEDGSSVTLAITGEARIRVPGPQAQGDTLLVGMHVVAQARADASDNLFARSVMAIPGQPTLTHRVGTVTAYAAGSSISILAVDGQSYSFALTADTKLLPAGLADTLAVDSRVTVIAPRDVSALGWTATGIVVHPPLP